MKQCWGFHGRSRAIRIRIRPVLVIPFTAACVLLSVALSMQVAPAAMDGERSIIADGPPSEEEVQLSKAAAPSFSLPTDLQQRFPRSFGGTRAIDNSNLVISIVDSEPDEAEHLRNYVRSIVEESLSTVGRSTTFTFEPAKVSFEHRINVQQKILRQISDGGEFAGLGVTSVGLDAFGLSVWTKEPSSVAELELSRSFPEVPFTVRSEQFSTATASRFADSAPWNGGDVLAVNVFGFAAHRCTSGPGAHKATGARFLLLAGHCGSNSYFNTSFGSPSLNNPVGSTAASIYSNGYPDIQIVSANSSRYFWEGPGSGVRRTTLAAVDPVVGYTVCGQGATTAAWGSRNCGVVSETNMADTPVLEISTGVITLVSGLFLWDGSAALGGDSGGYISLSTVYGYGAVGTITSSNPNGSPPYTTGIPVAFHTFIWGLTLNTPANP